MYYFTLFQDNPLPHEFNQSSNSFPGSPYSIVLAELIETKLELKSALFKILGTDTDTENQ